MQKSSFRITEMDCPSEENLIRMKLGDLEGIKHLDFDIPNRSLVVFHKGDITLVETTLGELNLGATLLHSEISTKTEFSTNHNQRMLLWTVLLINFAFFVIEMTTGWLSKSMGLVADSLDMLADALVYGLSLYAVGGTVAKKKNVAKMAGYFQIVLAAIGLLEVLRRFFGAAQMPDFLTMIIVSILALTANGICLYLLQKSKNKEEAHIQASAIFTSNDIIINLGVIAAALLVNWFNSPLPDLLIGIIVF
ncbi:MAG: cation transporter, partial [Bacteroidota bacterium]